MEAYAVIEKPISPISKPGESSIGFSKEISWMWSCSTDGDAGASLEFEALASGDPV